jgi:hypothetical protein
LDSSATIELTDRTIIYYLDKYLIYWKTYDETEGHHHNEKTIHDIKKCMDIVNKNRIDKDRLDRKYKDIMSSY